jgi:hypothetical protein
MTETSLEPRDQRVRETAGAFLREALAAFPDGVASYALTGSCLTADYVPGSSDINSVLVLQDMSPEKLDALAAMGRRFGKKGFRAPLVMTPDYIERSLDVFPIEFLDIKLIHKTIHGAELFSGLTIAKPMLRLQCERDLKAKLINLRQGYISCSGDGKGLRALLHEAYAGYFPLFRAMLAVCGEGGEPPVLKGDVLTAMESRFGHGLDSLREIRAMGPAGFFSSGHGEAREIFNKVYKVTHELSLTMDRVAC